MNYLSSQFDVDYFSNCRNNMQKTVFFILLENQQLQDYQMLKQINIKNTNEGKIDENTL
jgi:hypothetical protein